MTDGCRSIGQRQREHRRAAGGVDQKIVPGINPSVLERAESGPNCTDCDVGLAGVALDGWERDDVSARCKPIGAIVINRTAGGVVPGGSACIRHTHHEFIPITNDKIDVIDSGFAESFSAAPLFMHGPDPGALGQNAKGLEGNTRIIIQTVVGDINKAQLNFVS